jgi:Cytochrome domain of cellobiose dehydrogenase
VILVTDTGFIALPSALAQSSTPVTFTDAASGIIFNTWPVADGGSTAGGFTFGLALPSNALTVDANEFIGYLVRSLRHFGGFLDTNGP